LPPKGVGNLKQQAEYQIVKAHYIRASRPGLFMMKSCTC
jgi:hypothetical protein